MRCLLTWLNPQGLFYHLKGVLNTTVTFTLLKCTLHGLVNNLIGVDYAVW